MSVFAYLNDCKLWALARNEYRVCGKLNRTKFILVFTFLICVWYFLIVTLSHLQTSGLAPMFGVINPRYLTSLLGSSFIALFCVGVLVLAFDIQSRDERNRIDEVIASKPVGNVELYLGRLFGIFLCMGIPLVAVVVLAVVYGWISEIFAIPFGEPIELWSVISLLLLDVLPNFVFFGFLALFLASFIRPRFIALLLAICCLYGVLWLNSRLPLWASTPLQTVSGGVIFPSELTPTFLTAEILFNRIALILMGVGFLYWLSVLHSRNISPSEYLRVKGLCAYGAGLFFIAGMFGAQILEQQKISSWKRVHDAHFEPASFPDVRHIEGAVEIYPGRTVSLDLSMLVSILDDDRVEDVLFSFNPGYRINNLSIDGKDIEDHKFRSGLLQIPRRHFDAEVVTLNLRAKGRPNSQFAYLDSVEKVVKIFGPEVRQLRYLGTENYIFRPEFVVLMPGVKWYPVAGTATHEEDWSQRYKDFFTVDLTVSVPRNWIVAGPAQRKLVPEEKRTTYRFDTVNPIPQLALVASQFERAAQVIDGIEFEVLYSGVHRHNFEKLTPIGEDLLDTVQDLLNEVKTAGLEYPYTVFSLVETPASLRTYGGGSKLDSVLGMPGVLMMPETTFPTMHLNSFYDSGDYSSRHHRKGTEYELTEREWMQWLLGKLPQYFGIEHYAGNHLNHFYRAIVSDQTSATGPRAELLNLILEQVVQLIFTKYELSFDFDLSIDRQVLDLTYIEPSHIINLGTRASNVNSAYGVDRHEQIGDLRDARFRKLTTDEILDAVESVRLADYDSHDDHDSVENRAMRVRARAVNDVLIESQGLDSIDSILTELLRRYRGKNFSYDDFVAVAQSQGVDVENLVGDMLHSSKLPGFIASDLTKDDVGTDGEEDTRFQASFILTNGEDVSGYCLIIPENDVRELVNRGDIDLGSKLLFLEKNQSLKITIDSKTPILNIAIVPYLSLNRNELRVAVTPMQDYDVDKWGNVWGGDPEITISEVETIPSKDAESIVVDDLDEGFSIVDSRGSVSVNPFTIIARRLAGTSVREQIRGLPAYQFERDLVSPDTWERASDPTAYGRYWRTSVLNRDGKGETYAKFVATLPASGLWRLDHYLPKGVIERVRNYQGAGSIEVHYLNKSIANFDVHVDSEVITQSIDQAELSSGWQTVGEFDVENPYVEVWISNTKRYNLTYADAIRWAPVEDSN
ncbi:MAG: hypothetical protein F4Z14_11405 [Gammaproteobacteria bacterium]|nr:hypothetical protein [Gammaproteobacteria bacterium]